MHKVVLEVFIIYCPYSLKVVWSGESFIEIHVATLMSSFLAAVHLLVKVHSTPQFLSQAIASLYIK